MKLYEKSKVKIKFLRAVCEKLNIKANIYENDYANHNINSKNIVSRAFKKLDEHIKISREIIQVRHKLIILKGKNAKMEIKNLSKKLNYSYVLKESITSPGSKIIILEINK